MAVYTTTVGTNADLVADLVSLYFKQGWKIADVTYGKGVFWKKVDKSLYNFYCSDIVTCKNALYDFRNLPYDNNYFDCVVLDPPYMHTVGRPMVDDNYQNSATTRGLYHTDIMELYKSGIIEAYRILKTGGFLLLKCQDEIESGYQRWSHIELYNIATSLGFYGKDLFVLVRQGNPHIQYKQKHARKKHSYMWLFQKLNTKKHSKLVNKNII